MYIRQTSGAGVPVYKVKAVNGNNITLDIPSQEASGAGVDSKTLTAAVVGAANCGIKLVGLAAYHKVGLYPYHKVSFEYQLDGWGDTVSDTSTAAQKGDTVGEAVADMEWFSLSKNSPGSGTWTGNGFPSVESYAELKAVDASNYDLVTIDYTLEQPNNSEIVGQGKIKGSVVIAIDGAVNQNQDHFNDIVAGIDGITDILSV